MYTLSFLLFVRESGNCQNGCINAFTKKSAPVCTYCFCPFCCFPQWFARCHSQCNLCLRLEILNSVTAHEEPIISTIRAMPPAAFAKSPENRLSQRPGYRRYQLTIFIFIFILSHHLTLNYLSSAKKEQKNRITSDRWRQVDQTDLLCFQCFSSISFCRICTLTSKLFAIQEWRKSHYCRNKLEDVPYIYHILSHSLS